MIKDVYIKITKEKYDEYKKLNISVLNKMIEDTIPVEWKCGYGWYGCNPVEKNGEFFLRHRIGSSCD